MSEEDAKIYVEKLKERIDTVRRYQRVNDKIDVFKLKAGILPQFIIPGGEYATLYLHPEYETKWKGTFFDKERMFLSTSLKNVHSLSKYHYFEELGKGRPHIFWILGYCDGAYGCEEGILIHLVDPYGEVTLPPFAMPTDMIMCYVGKMLMVKVEFCQDVVRPTEVATLPFTLTEKITKDHPLYDTLTE